MSIPLNLEEPDVLRRTLVQLDGQSIRLTSPIASVNQLASDATPEETTAAYNALAESFNALATVVNATNTKATN